MRNKKIQSLSLLLNRLPIFSHRPDQDKFRNVNGVALKLANFKAIELPGTGMKSYSQLDKQVFEEFLHDHPKLFALAAEIRKAVESPDLHQQLEEIPDDDPLAELSVKEGQVLYRLHRIRERNKQIVDQKKRHVLQQKGAIACEICQFDFEKTYGEIGKGFIECHHKTPLASLKVDTQTTLEDLVLVCSNCHRMLHRGWTGFNIVNPSS